MPVILEEESKTNAFNGFPTPGRTSIKFNSVAEAVNNTPPNRNPVDAPLWLAMFNVFTELIIG